MAATARSALVFLIALFSLGSSVFAEDEVPRPVIKVDGATYSFGTVPQGTLVKHDFIIQNDGNANLTIQKAPASCGCTVALPPSGPILPGQSAPLTVTFDTSGFEGDKEKTVRVFSNDTQSTQPILTLRGRIESPLDIKPVRISFGDIVKGEDSATEKVSAKLQSGVEGSIKSIETFSKIITLQNVSNKGSEVSADVVLSTASGSGEVRERVLITFQFKDGREQTFNVPVVASIASGVSIQPKTLSLGVITGDQPIVKNARIVNNLKTPISIVSASSDSPAVRVSVKQLRAGKIFGVSVSVDPKAVAADLKATVTIVTNSEEQPRLTMNVYGIVSQNP